MMSTTAVDIASAASYSGIVTISIKKGNRKYPIVAKNQGTRLFFDLITKCLAGYDVKENLPYGIMVKDEEGNPMLTQIVPFSGIVYGSEAMDGDMTSTQSALLLNAIILNEEKSPAFLNVSSDNNIYMCIVDKFGYELASITQGVHDMWNSLNETSDAVIEWKLYFKNTAPEVKYED